MNQIIKNAEGSLLKVWIVKYRLIQIIMIVLLSPQIVAQTARERQYMLYKKIKVPDLFLQSLSSQQFGGDLRIGDLNNDGQLDFLVYQAANHVLGGATQPCFLGAFTMEGEILWQKGEKGKQPLRPGPVAIYDIDADNENEVICFFTDDTTQVSPYSMENVKVLILDGKNGKIEKAYSPPVFSQISGTGPNWVHQRLVITNLQGNPTPQEFIIKLGKNMLAFDNNLNVLWNYYNGNDTYRNSPAYIPFVGDADNDGRDEVNGGYYLLDSDGSVLWEQKLGKNMDCVQIDYWDNDTVKRAFCSGYGFIMDHKGDTILMLGKDEVPHGQELRVGNFDPDYKGQEMIIRYDGHNTPVKVVSSETKSVIREYSLNDTPNNTGMEVVYWNGSDQPALLCNGNMLWQGDGTLYCEFKELAEPTGSKKQCWYHCVVADITGDDGEEVILYNPCEEVIFIFTAYRQGWKKKKKYVPTAKQYNARLMD